MRKTIARIVLLVFSAGVMLHVSLLVYVQSHAFGDTAKPSDVIIVLGTRPNKHGANPCLVARVRQAARLQRDGFAQNILFSGGKLDDDELSEAEVMEEIAPDFSIEKETVLIEPRSTSTYENLLFSSAILREKRLNSVIIVSDAYHLPRAALIAEKLGLNYSVSPAADSPCTTELHNKLLFFIHEPLKIAWYKLTGRI